MNTMLKYLLTASLCVGGITCADETSPEKAELEANTVETISILRAEIADLKNKDEADEDDNQKAVLEELAELRREVDLLKQKKADSHKFEMEKEIADLRKEVATLKAEVNRKDELLKKQSALVTKVLNFASKRNTDAASALNLHNYPSYTTRETTSSPFGTSTTTRTVGGTTFGTGSTTIVIEKHVPTSPQVIYVPRYPPSTRIIHRKPSRPGKYYTWRDGYWHWSGHKWVWIRGKWVHSPRNSIKWRKPRYSRLKRKDHRDPVCKYQPGAWIKSR